MASPPRLVRAAGTAHLAELLDLKILRQINGQMPTPSANVYQRQPLKRCAISLCGNSHVGASVFLIHLFGDCVLQFRS